MKTFTTNQIRRFLLLLLTVLVAIVMAICFTACNDGGNSSDSIDSGTESNGDTDDNDDSDPEPLKQFTDITFENSSYVYDGSEKTIKIAGDLPQGASVQYENNAKTNAGTYSAKATLTCEGYQTKTLTATLTINKADFTGITFSNGTFNYDGTPHLIEVVGQFPQGTNVAYACEENASITNAATETGAYTIKATITNSNYNTKTLTATLKINASDKERHIAYLNGMLYFANALDGNKLYSYTTAEGVQKVSSDTPYNFTVADGKIYFRSYSVIYSSVKTVGNTGVNTVAPVKGEYLCTDGTYLYYAVNGLTENKSGIYKLDPTASEPEGKLLSQGKAKYLQYLNGKIYFADGSNGWKLSSITVSGGARTLVLDEKITCLNVSGTKLYYTVNNLLGNFIQSYDVSNGETKKLTSDAGSNLTVIGSRLYYVNVDLLNTEIFGDGIYYVDANPSSDRDVLPGKKFIGDGKETYSSLTEMNGNLAYYRVSDQMLCVYNLSTNTEIEILDGFTAPETTPLSLGSKTAAYGNYIYFMDLYNDKALYNYNVVTGVTSRITSNKVTDFSILSDTLYYNAVSYGVNNDLYKVDLKLGGEPELVSKNDCVDVVTDGTNLFYVEQNAAGARTAVHKIDASGNDTVMYTKGASNLTYYDGYVYFLDGSKIYRMPVTGFTVDATETVTSDSKISHADTFVISKGVVYFREQYGLGWGFKRLSRVNVDGTGYTVMLTSGTDPLELCVISNKVYYYNDVASGTSGLHCIDADAHEDKVPTLILECNAQNPYYASGFTVKDGKIYFINYRSAVTGDAHLYCVNIANGEVNKLA